jgi:1-acyl-sn-glycerol-3-phosphate acyltransferase
MLNPVLRAPYSLFIWMVDAFFILIWLPLMAVFWITERDPRRLRTARTFRLLGPMFGKVNPWRVHVSGREHLTAGGVYVVVSNHQSFADIPVISHIGIDTKWLGKAELFRVPVIGWMMRMAGDVPVSRGDRRQSARALLQCARYLRQGCSVVFFPEGTRSRDGRVLPFNDGPFQLAIREQIPILPLVVEGSGNALPRDTWLFGEAADIHLVVLPPVSVAGWKVAQSAELREEVRGLISAELERLRATEVHLGR